LKDLNTVPSFSFIFRKFYLRNAVQKNISRTIISGKQQNSNKQMAEFRISTLF